MLMKVKTTTRRVPAPYGSKQRSWTFQQYLETLGPQERAKVIEGERKYDELCQDPYGFRKAALRDLEDDMLGLVESPDGLDDEG